MLAAQGSYAMGASAASGASALALSYALMTGMQNLMGNAFVLTVANASPTDPMHVEIRSIWTDKNSVSQTTTLGVGFSGASAVTIQKLVLVGSSESIAIPYTNIVGSAIRVMLLNAISGTGAGGSGTVALWTA